MSDVANLGGGARRTRPLLRTLVGSVLRRHRLRQDRTLAEVARDACVSMPYLSEVERGRKEASSEVLAAVCDALGIDLADLLAEVGRDLLDDRAPVVPLRMVRLGGAITPTSAPAAPRSAQRPGGVVLLAA
jgi:transcriptional regulator with XRE-family HTH domain